MTSIKTVWAVLFFCAYFAENKYFVSIHCSSFRHIVLLEAYPSTIKREGRKVGGKCRNVYYSTITRTLKLCPKVTYRKVVNSSLSRLVAPFQIFSRLMKGGFGQKNPKLNCRPVYCSQLYCIHNQGPSVTLLLVFGKSLAIKKSC